MGYEILYCTGCRAQLRGPDFDKWRAFRIEGIAYCRKCAPEGLKALPPEQVGALLETVARNSETRSKEAKDEARSSSSRRLRVVPASSADRNSNTSSAASRFSVVAIAGGIGVGVILAIALATGSSSKPLPPVIVNKSVPPAPPSPPSTGIQGTVEESRSARKLLQAAHILAKETPGSHLEQLALLERALAESKGTPLEREITSRMVSVKESHRLAIGAALSGIDRSLGMAIRGEAFGEAKSILRKAGVLRTEEYWASEIAKRVETLEREIETLFAAAKSGIVENRRKGNSDKVQAALLRVKAWGIPELTKELDEAARNTPLASTSPPGSSRFDKKWSHALSFVASREFHAASDALLGIQETLSKSLQTEALEDARRFRKVAEVYTQTYDLLGSPSVEEPAQTVQVEYFDEEGKRRSSHATLEQQGKPWLLTKSDDGSVRVPIGELTSRSLVRLYNTSRTSTTLQPDPAILAIMLLLEGDVKEARKFSNMSGADPVPNRFWSYAEEANGVLSHPEELSARSLYYTAESETRVSATATLGIEKFHRLLSEYDSTAFVRRNRDAIEAQVGARELLLFASDMKGEGAFRRVVDESTGGFWTSAQSVEPNAALTNYVELAYSTLPEYRYKCWLYLGACCREGLSFHYQATELKAKRPGSLKLSSAEPGSASSVRISRLFYIRERTHASHGGTGQPQFWNWVPISLPKVDAPGPRHIRVLSTARGASIRYALITSIRNSPPRKAELASMCEERGVVVASPSHQRSQPPSRGLPRVVTLTPEADISLEEENPDRDLGDEPRLKVEAQAGQNARIFLRFNVTELPKGAVVSEAKIVLHCSSNSDEGGQIRLFEPVDEKWDEATPTWNNPLEGKEGSDLIDRVGPIASGDAVTFKGLEKVIRGNGRYTFLIRSTSHDGAKYRSKEHPVAEQRPVLSLSFTSP